MLFFVDPSMRRPVAKPVATRETLHALTNSLAAARMWLVVFDNTPREQRGARLDELLAKLNQAVGDAEVAAHCLRELLLAPAKRRRK